LPNTWTDMTPIIFLCGRPLATLHGEQTAGREHVRTAKWHAPSRRSPWILQIAYQSAFPLSDSCFYAVTFLLIRAVPS